MPWLPLIALVLGTCLLVDSGTAQPPPAGQQPPAAAVEVEPAPQEPEVPRDPDDPEGRTVVDIRIEPATSADTILRIIKTKVGQPFQAAAIRRDMETLWSRLKIYSKEVSFEVVDGGVRVFFLVDESSSFDRFEFKGLDHFKEKEVRSLLGIDARQRINRRAADQYAGTLRDRYKREGFAFAEVRIQEDPDQSTLTFWVDEGPQVTVRNIHFVGNQQYPSHAPMGAWDNLLGSADLAASESGLFGGQPFSKEIVDEDLDRLRFFYRRKGFRDAYVELANVAYTADRSEVDLTYRVIEGRRYRISGIELLQSPPPGQSESLYDHELVVDQIEIEVGDFYDHDQIQMDKKRVADFYGRRGHPQKGRYGRGIDSAFEISDPIERFDPEKAEVHLTFVVDEGSPKRLRDVVIRGNTYTRDFVIRRKVFLMPGDLLDMTAVDRSQRTLDALQYFQDPQSFSGVLFELLPVEGDPDEVDLAIDVQEGDTGSFLWGAGVSTATGVQARFVLSKRNFDFTRLPSSINPITWFEEIGNNSAFHGAGQDIELTLAPGTQISMFSLSFREPDLFRTYFDTIGLRLQAYKRIQFWDTYDQDSLGGQVGFDRFFNESVSVGLTVRAENIEISDIDADAPLIVWESEGRTEMRGLRMNLDLNSLDVVMAPTSGARLNIYGELVGGPFGGDASFWKAGVAYTHYFPLYEDLVGRNHTLRWRNRFDFAETTDDREYLFVTERFYMGGNNLRGFEQRGAGPSQFSNPVGGEIRLLSSLQYEFPIFSTRRQGQLRETEVLRGVIFSDFGMLGLTTDDIGAPRLSAGFGIRLNIPMLNVPIALDLGWPILREGTDDTRQVLFSLSRM